MKTKFKSILPAAALLFGFGQVAWAGHAPDHVGLVEVGPLPVDNPLTLDSNEANGFPLFYTDANGLSLELCLGDPANGNLADPLCLVEPDDPGAPISFPGNFGGEAFWQSAEIVGLELSDGGSVVIWRGDVEAAFAFENPAAGDQVAFGRVRLRIDTVTPGTYRITHPYGRVMTHPGGDGFACTPEIFEEVGTGIKAINNTNDVGNFLTPGENFGDALAGGVGPFLEAVNPPPPAGYIGSPLALQTVTGSPCGFTFNVFRVERLVSGTGPDDPLAEWEVLGETDRFSLAGKKITVAAGPIARNDFLKMENVPSPLPVLANDVPRTGTAIDKATLAIGATAPVSGSAFPIDDPLDPDFGKVLYTPDPASIVPFTDTFSYTVFDNTPAEAPCVPSADPPVVVCPPPFQSNEATVQVEVLAPAPPSAGNDAAITPEDTAKTIEVLANDTDNVAVDPGSVALVIPLIGPNNGTALVNLDGTVTYTPDPNFFGADSFLYTVRDFNGGLSNQATVNVTVTSVNDPPVANNDAAETKVNLPLAISVLGNDTDVDDLLAPATLQIVGTPPIGATLTVDTTNGRVNFVAGTQGLHTFFYRVKDLAGALSNVAKVDVTVINPTDVLTFNKANCNVTRGRPRGNCVLNGRVKPRQKGTFVDLFANDTCLGAPVAQAKVNRSGGWKAKVLISALGGGVPDSFCARSPGGDRANKAPFVR